MTYPFTLGYEYLLSLMWQCLNNCCDENCCLITPAGVTTPWAHLLIVFSCLHLFTFLFFQVLSTLPLFLHIFCTLFWFVVFFCSHSRVTLYAFRFSVCFVFSCHILSTPPSLHIFSTFSHSLSISFLSCSYGWWSNGGFCYVMSSTTNSNGPANVSIITCNFTIPWNIGIVVETFTSNCEFSCCCNT